MFLFSKKGINTAFNEPHILNSGCGILVVTSQSTNKKFGAPTPSRFVYKQVNAQPY